MPKLPLKLPFGDLCKFQHVASQGQNGKPEGQNVRAVGVQDSPTDEFVEQKIDQFLTAALTRVALKFTACIAGSYGNY